MEEKLKVLFVASECQPYASTGGLGDVAAALPEAVAGEGIDIRRIIPLYRPDYISAEYEYDFPIQMVNRYQDCIIKHNCSENAVPTYFVGNSWFFNRDKLYGYYEDGERFIFFCKSVMKMLDKVGFYPDIIHCNDWHTGFIPFFVKKWGLPVKSVFTIHNLGYHGWISSDYIMEYLSDGEDLMLIEDSNGLNFMKAGILYSDYITTVSRGYAREILTPLMGCGMDDFLRDRKDKIAGIMNGIDCHRFNPSEPGNAQVPYDINHIDLKKENKRLLRSELGLQDDESPLVSMITRLDEQKGVDLVIKSLEKMDLKRMQLTILGTGNIYYEKVLEAFAAGRTGRVAVKFAFDLGLAKRIYAGSDIFIMPSKYEPGGLGQLYAMAYGTVPVVRRTGGLRDTVIDLSRGAFKANGFCFEKYTVNAFMRALNRAIDVYHTEEWRKLMENDMKTELSWRGPAIKYASLYRDLLRTIPKEEIEP
jgi:starch synthase